MKKSNVRKRTVPAKIFICLLIAAVCSLFFILISNLSMTIPARNRIHPTEYYAQQAGNETGKQYDAIIVLGCSVRPDGSPSAMLADRMDEAIELYRKGCAPVLLVTGDESENYSEIAVMKAYALERGVPEAAILEDGKGYSTYESMSRASREFGLKKVLVVTQRYHLPRALYIGSRFGIDADGAAAFEIIYSGQLMRDIREVAARSKDFLQCIFKPRSI